MSVLGWDIGGANTKAACLHVERDGSAALRTASRPFEIWKATDRLTSLLQDLAAEVASDAPEAMALTMTAELSDAFRTKREGVLFVLDSVATAFPSCPVYGLGLRGGFMTLEQGREHPLDLAASNWLATALWLAEAGGDLLLVDIGSTTCDLIPVVDGRVAAVGRTDLDRLMAGELVYTGVLRTDLAAIVRRVPVRGRYCPVAAEYFAISGDVHLILGHLGPDAYTCPTPDGRPATVEFARERLARLVCADREQLAAAEMDAIAAFVHQEQLRQVEEAVVRVCSRFGARWPPLMPLGGGGFLAREVAVRLALSVVEPPAGFSESSSEVAPCVAVAHLLRRHLETGSTC